MSPNPIRVGLIGLSTSGSPGKPGAWGILAHLPSLVNSPHYKLVALANSSVESAKASIAAHELGPEVKAYGSAEDLSKDRDVDLVVVSVNVGKHYDLTKPALLAKKDVFVEWPLGATTSEAEDLTTLAHQSGVKTVVGTQARADPLVSKVKELAESGRIGKVISSTVVGQFGGLRSDQWPQSAEYYLDIKSGGNPLTIYFGHFLDSFIHVLGDFTQINSVLKTQYPTIKLLDDAGRVVDARHPKTAPDHIVVQGTLSSGAVASLSYRTAATSVDGVGVRWIITGTEGEIEVITPEIAWQMGPPGTAIKVRSGKDGEVENVEFGSAGVAEKVGFPGKNTALTYEAFATGETGKFATFESALKTHRLLDAILTGSEK